MTSEADLVLAVGTRDEEKTIGLEDELVDLINSERANLTATGKCSNGQDFDNLQLQYLQSQSAQLALVAPARVQPPYWEPSVPRSVRPWSTAESGATAASVQNLNQKEILCSMIRLPARAQWQMRRGRTETVTRRH